MICNLYDILLRAYGTEAAIAKAFNVERAAHWRKNVPERIALLCHLSPLIPYTYNPSEFDRDMKGLGIEIKQQKGNDHASIKSVSNADINDHCRAS